MVKWTPDKDQMLLLKILETHELSVDTKKISAAWPSTDGDVPTPRAISERLVKIRQLAKANGSGHFGISKGTGANTPPTTPRKRRAAAPKTPAPRKRSGLIKVENTNGNGNGSVHVKVEGDDDDEHDGDGESDADMHDLGNGEGAYPTPDHGNSRKSSTTTTVRAHHAKNDSLSTIETDSDYPLPTVERIIKNGGYTPSKMSTREVRVETYASDEQNDSSASEYVPIRHKTNSQSVAPAVCA